MRQHRRRSARIVLALAATALLFSVPRAGRGMPPVRPETHAIAPGAALQERAAVATTPHFAFYSDLATNLNDALIAAGDARRRGRAELFHSGDGEAAGAASIAAAEQQCFDALPAAERAGWERAVDYYAEIVAPSGNFGNEQLLLRSELAGLPGQASDAEDRRFVEIAGGFRTAASPAYEACRWAAQDGENRRWIDELLLRLAAHEETIASRLEHLYQTSWHGLPLTVDVVSTALPTGASSIIIGPAGGHILVSSLDDGNQGTAALEVVFHEGSHTIMRRSDPVQQALDEAAEALEVQAPRDLWHVVLFYTTGETVRRVLDESGELGYAPYLYQGLFERAWPQLQRPIESTWPAYLNGERTLQEASRDLLRAIAGVAPKGRAGARTV
jgi:hypothetical protein